MDFTSNSVPVKFTADWITRVSPNRYFVPIPPSRQSWSQPAKVGYRPKDDYKTDPPDSDAYTLVIRRMVSVAPLSLDLTARIDLGDFERSLRKTQPG